MSHLSLRPIGFAAAISWEVLTVLMLAHLALLGDSPQGEFQLLWLQGLYPGFQELNVVGILIALVQGFIWPWIFAALFVSIHNKFAGKS